MSKYDNDKHTENPIESILKQILSEGISNGSPDDVLVLLSEAIADLRESINDATLRLAKMKELQERLNDPAALEIATMVYDLIHDHEEH